MSSFKVYSKNTALKYPPEASFDSREAELVEAVVLANHADIYYRPDERLLVFKIIARYTSPGQSSRRDKYYVVQRGVSKADILSSLTGNLQRMVDDEQWVFDEAADDLKTHAIWLDEFGENELTARTPAGTVEYGIKNALNSEDAPRLNLGLSSFRDAIRLLGNLDTVTEPVLIGRNLSPEELPGVGMYLTYGEEFDGYGARDDRTWKWIRKGSERFMENFATNAIERIDRQIERLKSDDPRARLGQILNIYMESELPAPLDSSINEVAAEHDDLRKSSSVSESVITVLEEASEYLDETDRTEIFRHANDELVSIWNESTQEVSRALVEEKADEVERIVPRLQAITGRTRQEIIPNLVASATEVRSTESWASAVEIFWTHVPDWVKNIFRSVDSNIQYELFEELKTQQKYDIFVALPDDQLLRLFNKADPKTRRRVVTGLGPEGKRKLVASLGPDEKVELVEAVGTKEARSLVTALGPEQVRELVSDLDSPTSNELVNKMDGSAATELVAALDSNAARKLFDAIDLKQKEALISDLHTIKQKQLFKSVSDATLQELFESLSEDRLATLFGGLDVESKRVLFDALTTEQRRQVFGSLTRQNQRQFVSILGSDERSELVAALDDNIQTELLAALNDEARANLLSDLDGETASALVAALPDDRKRNLVESLDESTRRDLVRNSSFGVTQLLFESLDENTQAAVIDKLDASALSSLLDRFDPWYASEVRSAFEIDVQKTGAGATGDDRGEGSPTPGVVIEGSKDSLLPDRAEPMFAFVLIGLLAGGALSYRAWIETVVRQQPYTVGPLLLVAGVSLLGALEYDWTRTHSRGRRDAAPFKTLSLLVGTGLSYAIFKFVSPLVGVGKYTLIGAAVLLIAVLALAVRHFEPGINLSRTKGVGDTPGARPWYRIAKLPGRLYGLIALAVSGLALVSLSVAVATGATTWTGLLAWVQNNPLLSGGLLVSAVFFVVALSVGYDRSRDTNSGHAMQTHGSVLDKISIPVKTGQLPKGKLLLYLYLLTAAVILIVVLVILGIN